MHRCSNRMLAEDLTQEVLLAAARSVRDGTAADFGAGWLIGVARPSSSTTTRPAVSLVDADGPRARA